MPQRNQYWLKGSGSREFCHEEPVTWLPLAEWLACKALWKITLGLGCGLDEGFSLSRCAGRDKVLRTETAVYAVMEVGTWTGGVLFYGKMEPLGMLSCGSRNSWKKSVLKERERFCWRWKAQSGHAVFSQESSAQWTCWKFPNIPSPWVNCIVSRSFYVLCMGTDLSQFCLKCSQKGSTFSFLNTFPTLWCSSLLSCCCANHDQKQIREERFISDYTSRSQSILKKSQGRNRSRKHGQKLFPDFSLVHAQLASLYNLGPPTYSGMVPCTVGWALHQLTVKKLPQRYAHRSNWWMEFFSWGFLFLGDSRLCLVVNGNLTSIGTEASRL